jgi:O-antigen/teichoic acid export membrane protein
VADVTDQSEDRRGPIPEDDLGLDEETRFGDASTLGRGGTLNAVGSISFAIFGFALVTIVTRSLGSAGAGAFLESVAVFSIIARTSVLGADLGLVRFVSRFRGRGFTGSIRPMILIALAPVLAVSATIATALLVFAHPVANLVSDAETQDQVATYLRLLAPFIPVSAVYLTLDGCAQGFGTMVPSVTVERITRPLLVALLVLAVTAAGMGQTAVALSWALPWAIALAATSTWVMRLLTRTEHGGTRGPHLGRRTLLTRFWRFSVPRSLGALLQQGILWADTLLIGALASTSEAGIYAAATRFLIVGTFAGMAITTAFAPQISPLLGEDYRPRAASLFKTATVWFILLAWPVYLTVSIFGPALVDTFGHGFDDGAIVLPIVSVGFLFAAATGPIDIMLLMGGRSSLSMLNNLAALVTNIGLNVLLIPSIGLKGAALAWTASLVMMNLLPTIEVHKTMGYLPFSGAWVRAVVVAAVTIAVPELLTRAILGPTRVGLAVGLFVAAVSYLAVVWSQREHFHLDAFLNGLRRSAPQAPEPVEAPVLASASTASTTDLPRH